MYFAILDGEGHLKSFFSFFAFYSKNDSNSDFTQVYSKFASIAKAKQVRNSIN